MKSRNGLFWLAFSMLIFALMPVCLKAQINQPELQIHLSKNAPVIDGNLSDAPWESSAELSEFVKWSLDSYCKDAVTVFLCYD